MRAMDVFIQTVEDARQRLGRLEGSPVSGRELIRRAGFPESQRAGVAYHLNPRRHSGEKPHRVPPDVVEKLGAVLRPVLPLEELQRAAQVAAGYTVIDRDVAPDVAYVVSRFYGDEEVTEQEKAAVTARILQIIAGESAKGAGRPTHPQVTELS